MKNVLVTGGAGYVGSHACKAIAKAGYTPVVFDNLSTGHDWAVKWGPFERGDILDRNALERVFNEYQPIALMHFAGLIAVGESVEKPDEYQRVNVMGSLNVLDAMLTNDCRSVVFSSSAAVYASESDDKISESAPLAPESPYGQNKKDVEEKLSEYGNAHGVNAISLRYFNASGADQDGLIGEDHEPETHLIPLAIHTALGNRKMLQIYGDDYPTPDGTCIRDYVHVSDLAEAHVSAMEKLLKEGGIDAINIGGGADHSVRDVIEAVRNVSQRDISVEVTSRRAGDSTRLVADITRARALLDWQPRQSSLQNIVATAWKWHQKHHGDKTA